jgi:hypothetical protein
MLISGLATLAVSVALGVWLITSAHSQSRSGPP